MWQNWDFYHKPTLRNLPTNTLTIPLDAGSATDQSIFNNNYNLFRLIIFRFYIQMFRRFNCFKKKNLFYLNERNKQVQNRIEISFLISSWIRCIPAYLLNFILVSWLAKEGSRFIIFPNSPIYFWLIWWQVPRQFNFFWAFPSH